MSQWQTRWAILLRERLRDRTKLFLQQVSNDLLQIFTGHSFHHPFAKLSMFAHLTAHININSLYGLAILTGFCALETRCRLPVAGRKS